MENIRGEGLTSQHRERAVGRYRYFCDEAGTPLNKLPTFASFAAPAGRSS